MVVGSRRVVRVVDEEEGIILVPPLRHYLHETEDFARRGIGRRWRDLDAFIGINDGCGLPRCRCRRDNQPGCIAVRVSDGNADDSRGSHRRGDDAPGRDRLLDDGDNARDDTGYRTKQVLSGSRQKIGLIYPERNSDVMAGMDKPRIFDNDIQSERRFADAQFPNLAIPIRIGNLIDALDFNKVAGGEKPPDFVEVPAGQDDRKGVGGGISPPNRRDPP